MDGNIKNSPCKECLDSGVHPPPLAEAEHLRHHLSERDNQIITLEADLIKCNTKICNLEEQVATWREKYERLYDAHKRVQKLNQNLEDKLLQMVDKMKDDKTQLTKDIATLSIRLAESKNSYGTLQKENERYKNDMNLAIQLLQCKPDNFVSQKLDNLPLDTQNRVSQYIMSKSKPAATAASKNENENTESSEYEFNISASLMTNILAESIQDTVTKHCDTCSCSTAQTKPFTYNETHYSVATQTLLSGDIKTTNLICKEGIESSYVSSPGNAGHKFKIIKDQYNYNMPRPMYIIPQPSLDNKNVPPTDQVKVFKCSDKITNVPDARTEKRKSLYDLEAKVKSHIIGEDLEKLKQNTGVEVEPAVHHKLCDRIKSTTVNKISSEAHAGLYVKELCPITNSVKSDSVDNVSFRKSSQGSMGGISRASSLAKSTSSANKSNTHVGPGPRFCSLRMQAGSKNILLDNAQPDVPPVLYKRQIKYADDVVAKNLNVGCDNFVDVEKNIESNIETVQNQLIVPTLIKKEAGVVETTLIDVHVDNNNKDLGAIPKSNSINPVLMNVSSSPLQPLKTHSFTNSNETNNNPEPSTLSDRSNIADVDNLLTKSNSDIAISNENSKENTDQLKANCDPPKIFNFDNYEQQSKISTQFNRPAGVVDINAIENTKISKDSPPKGLAPALVNTESETKAPSSSVVNVYPNLTQTHLKVNTSKKKFTEKSTSSLSSDDSAVLLHKQQLLRVAEWVEKNLEQQMNDVSLDEDINFHSKPRKKETLNIDENIKSVALNMPHPVSKYSKPIKVCKENAEGNSSQPLTKSRAHIKSKGKDPGKPVECKTSNNIVSQNGDDEAGKEPKELFTPEQMARIEYNVKKFLDGPSWDKPDENAERNRRTSSKTETDV